MKPSDIQYISLIIGIVGCILTILLVTWKAAQRLKSVEKEVESVPTIKERLVKLEEKTEEIKNLKDTIEILKREYWDMAGTLRVQEEILGTLKNRMKLT